jgi:DNA-binding transcriptional regulator LsrR (DeoR family)
VTRAGLGHSPLERLRALTAARRYYVEGLTKSEIAEELGISRFRVARLLATSLQDGHVRIEMAFPTSPVDDDLSIAVSERFHLKGCLVLAGGAVPSDTLRDSLGAIAAELLAEIAEPDDVIGIAWGRTLDAMADRLPPLPRCTVVQIVGGMPSVRLSANSMDLVRRVGERAGGPVYALHAPLLAPDARTAESLRHDPGVATTLAMFSELTKAVVAIGSWEPPTDSLMAAAVSADDLQAIHALGVVADVGATLLGRDGSSPSTPLDARRLAIGEAELREVPQVIAVAGGIGKLGAIRAVMRSGLVHLLVTDSAVARGLLDPAAEDHDRRA